MAESLNGIADLARDLAFRQRVRAAMTVCARDVGAESGRLDNDYNVRRWEAAKDMVMEAWSEDYVEAMVWLVAANPVIRRSSPDDDIQFTVNSVFPVVAACGPPPISTQSEAQ